MNESRKRAAVYLTGMAALLIAAGSIRHATGYLPDRLPSASQSSRAANVAVVSAPKRLLVPSLKIDVPLEEVGVNAQGEMEVPRDASIPGWYKGGVRPGQKGNAVIAGHKDTVGGLPGVFADLGVLKEGDLLAVEDLSGNVFSFRVTKKASYDARTAPVRSIFGKADAAHLQLITCSGSWLRTRGQYEERLVIFSELVP